MTVPVRMLEVAETRSTNELAMRLALAGDDGPLWVRSDSQTAGRGRSGRSWQSLAGNLHASLAMRLGASHRAAAQLSLVAGVAVVDAVREVAGAAAPAGLRVKWPNDILVADAKMGGILIECSTRPADRALVAVIGVGVNLAACPQDGDRRTLCLSDFGPRIEARAMLARLAVAMAAWIERWNDGEGFADIRDAWLDRAGRLGEGISVNTGAGRVDGRFAGLDGEGALLIECEAGRVQSFSFGDVTLLDAPHRRSGAATRKVTGADGG